MSARRNEQGGSTLSNIIWLLILAAMGYAVWNVGPVYIDHYSLQDKVTELARLPRHNNTDEQVADKLMREVRERRLTDYIARNNFQITTRETSRTINLEYWREATVLPGMKKTFHLKMTADQPLI